MRAAFLATLILTMTWTTSSVAQPADDFRACVAGLQQAARAAGISEHTVEGALATVEHQPRVIELDRHQPEFVTGFADYLGRRVTEQRVEKGRQLIREHSVLLNKLTREFGVPPQYLVAFWGLETNYGAFFGRMPVLDSLATLACDQRRSDYFTVELINALKIIDEGAVSPEQMQGSWAGAMGHVQFMPSAFLKHARDYDGDGRRDLWGSIPDAMASAAGFLQALGWERNLRWGREVRLPTGFDYARVHDNQNQSLAFWQSHGIERVDGSRLADATVEDLQAQLLLPTGHQGPAFLVYHNFHVIMGWNRSEAYALAVGHLADRIAGASNLWRTPQPSKPLRRDQIMQLQQTLKDLGYDPGNIDGIPGPATRAAISAFQKNEGLIPDGFISNALIEQLSISAP